MATKHLLLAPVFFFCLFLTSGNCALQSSAPEISITTPPAGRIIAGSVLVSTNASADVVRVQFRLDDQNLGSEITTPPFSMIWDTTLISNGPHTLTAIARDTLGHQAT